MGLRKPPPSYNPEPLTEDEILFYAKREEKARKAEKRFNVLFVIGIIVAVVMSIGMGYAVAEGMRTGYLTFFR